MIFFDIKKFIIIALIIISPLIFVNIKSDPLESNWLFQTNSTIILSLRKMYFNFYQSIAHTVNLYTGLIEVKKHNQFLKSENKRLKTQLLQMQELQAENKKLTQMLKFKNKTPFQLISTRVISHDPFLEYAFMTVDKGKEDGVQKHQLAIVESGVIGYVLRVQNNTSQILLLSNRNSILPVVIQRSRAQGLVEGLNKNLFHLKYLKNEDDFQEGDILVTSGISQNFPSGLPVGTISQIEKNDYGLDPKIEVTPVVEFSKIEELFIILNNNEQKI